MRLLSQRSQLLRLVSQVSLDHVKLATSNNHHESTLPPWTWHIPASSTFLPHNTFGYSCKICFSLHNNLSIIQDKHGFRLLGERGGRMWSPFPSDICATHQLRWNVLRQLPPPWLSRLSGANIALLWSLNETVCMFFYWKALSNQKAVETLKSIKLSLLYHCTHKHPQTWRYLLDVIEIKCSLKI